MAESRTRLGLTRNAALRLGVLSIVAVALVAVLLIPRWRSNARDVASLARVSVARARGKHVAAHPPTTAAENDYRSLRASGSAARVLAAARTQLGMPYVLGVGPRHAWSLRALGTTTDPVGFDCSTLVAYAFLQGAGVWISGDIAHTDEIWTQGGKLPLNTTPGKTSRVIRGTGAVPPPGGYQPGDILFRREGAGGYWGHVALVSERGYIIEALPPDVHETKTMTEVLADGDALGWMRVRALARNSSATGGGK